MEDGNNGIPRVLTDEDIQKQKAELTELWAGLMADVEIAITRLPSCLKKDAAFAKFESLAEIVEKIFRARWEPKGKIIRLN